MGQQHISAAGAITHLLPPPNPCQGFPLVLSLPLPAVNCEHVGVQHDGQAAYSGVEARQLAPQAWQALEAALHPGMDGHPSSTWLDGEQVQDGGRRCGSRMATVMLDASSICLSALHVVAGRCFELCPSTSSCPVAALQVAAVLHG